VRKLLELTALLKKFPQQRDALAPYRKASPFERKLKFGSADRNDFEIN
jgi:hypothetical protein